MPTLTYLDRSFDCTVAIKGLNYIHLLDENGVMIAAFDNILNFSDYTLTNGEYTAPTADGDCKVAVVRDDGTIGVGEHTCADIGKAMNGTSKFYGLTLMNYTTDEYFGSKGKIVTSADNLDVTYHYFDSPIPLKGHGALALEVTARAALAANEETFNSPTKMLKVDFLFEDEMGKEFRVDVSSFDVLTNTIESCDNSELVNAPTFSQKRMYCVYDGFSGYTTNGIGGFVAGVPHDTYWAHTENQISYGYISVATNYGMYTGGASNATSNNLPMNFDKTHLRGFKLTLLNVSTNNYRIGEIRTGVWLY